MKRIIRGGVAIIVGVLLCVGFGGFTAVRAEGLTVQESGICQDGNNVDPGLKNIAGCNETGDITSLVRSVVQLLLYAIGIISVVMIIYAGITMTISAGDTAKVTKAKNILIYSIIGLVVAILAYAIVHFAIESVGGE